VELIMAVDLSVNTYARCISRSYAVAPLSPL
jgi:hypothetical protein